MSSEVATLPFVDEHVAVIAAAPARLWAALVETVDHMGSGRAAVTYTRLVGCADQEPAGPRPLAEGSAVAGFHVVSAKPGDTLVLAGRHRFSTYALTFHLEPIDGGRTRLRAETRAAFPGLAGTGYRALVIGSRGHVVGMRRLLSAIRRRAERAG